MKPSLQEMKDIFIQNPLFQGVSDESLSLFVKCVGYAKHDKRHLLFLYGDNASDCFFIKKGHVKLFRENENGEEAVLSILPEGRVIGETGVLNGGFYHSSAETIGQTELLTFPGHALKTLVETEPVFVKNMMSHLADLSWKKDKEIENRVFQEAPQRIGCFLLALSPGRREGEAVFTLPYEKSVVAQKLGMRPETFSRALLKLQDEVGLKRCESGLKIDDIKKLYTYTCAGCADQFPCKKSKD